MFMAGSLHTANRFASPFVCAAHDDMPDDGWHYANMESEDRNFLGAWRNFRGLTQEELADAVGTTKSVVSLLENEQRPLSSKWLRKFAAVLETQPGYILDLDPNEIDTELMETWSKIDANDRKQAVRVLQSFVKTGTDN